MRADVCKRRGTWILNVYGDKDEILDLCQVLSERPWREDKHGGSDDGAWSAAFTPRKFDRRDKFIRSVLKNKHDPLRPWVRTWVR